MVDNAPSNKENLILLNKTHVKGEYIPYWILHLISSATFSLRQFRAQAEAFPFDLSFFQVHN